MSKIAIGINIYGQQERQLHCVEVLLKLKRKFYTEIELYNITFADEQNAHPEFVHLPLLTKSSRELIPQSGKRLPLANECFNALSKQNCDYFLYLNNDILVSDKLIKLLLKQEYETYSFSRVDVQPLKSIDESMVPIKIEIAGFDAWSCKSEWWNVHKDKFKNYVVGQWQWDVDFALTMYNHSNGIICNNDFYIAHEDHSRVWNSTSPEATYNDGLWKTTPYQDVWGEYIYSNLINRQPRGRFLYPLKDEESLAANLLKVNASVSHAVPALPAPIYLPQVTLICVDCKNHELATKALKYSSKSISFSKVMLLSDKKPKNFPNNFDFAQIPKISSTQEYSTFIIKELAKYVSTEFCLIIQTDGFVVNPHLWKEEFLNYDYIGAPWSQQNQWVESYDARVGNGGFSLRSKRLLEATSKFENVPTHEDLLFTQRRYFRNLIEQQFDLKIAPPYVAYRFSQEQIFPGLNVPLGQSFGFHGPKRDANAKDYCSLLTNL